MVKMFSSRGSSDPSSSGTIATISSKGTAEPLSDGTSRDDGMYVRMYICYVM